MISKAGFPGNPNFAISTEYNQTVFLIEFKMVDLVGNQFLIIKILKHKKRQTILFPELSLVMLVTTLCWWQTSGDILRVLLQQYLCYFWDVVNN